MSLITLATGEECEGNVFGSFVCLFVCLSVCLSVLVTQKTIASIDFLHKKYFPRGSVLLGDPDPGSDLGSIIYFRILHHCEIGQNMPSKHAATSNVCYDENMRSDAR